MEDRMVLNKKIMKYQKEIYLFFADPRIELDDKIDVLLWRDRAEKQDKIDVISCVTELIKSAYAKCLVSLQDEEYEKCAMYRACISSLRVVYRRAIATYDSYTLHEFYQIDKMCHTIDSSIQSNRL